MVYSFILIFTLNWKLPALKDRFDWFTKNWLELKKSRLCLCKVKHLYDINARINFVQSIKKHVILL